MSVKAGRRTEAKEELLLEGRQARELEGLALAWVQALLMLLEGEGWEWG